MQQSEGIQPVIANSRSQNKTRRKVEYEKPAHRQKSPTNPVAKLAPISNYSYVKRVPSRLQMWNHRKERDHTSHKLSIITPDSSPSPMREARGSSTCISSPKPISTNLLNFTLNITLEDGMKAVCYSVSQDILCAERHKDHSLVVALHSSSSKLSITASAIFPRRAKPSTAFPFAKGVNDKKPASRPKSHNHVARNPASHGIEPIPARMRIV